MPLREGAWPGLTPEVCQSETQLPLWAPRWWCEGGMGGGQGTQFLATEIAVSGPGAPADPDLSCLTSLWSEINVHVCAKVHSSGQTVAQLVRRRALGNSAAGSSPTWARKLHPP